MADQLKIGIDDIVASATEGVLRALSARKVRVEGLDFHDLVQSGYNVDFWIRAGGPFVRGPLGGGPMGPNGPLSGGGIG